MSTWNLPCLLANRQEGALTMKDASKLYKGKADLLYVPLSPKWTREPVHKLEAIQRGQEDVQIESLPQNTQH